MESIALSTIKKIKIIADPSVGNQGGVGGVGGTGGGKTANGNAPKSDQSAAGAGAGAEAVVGINLFKQSNQVAPASGTDILDLPDSEEINEKEGIEANSESNSSKFQKNANKKRKNSIEIQTNKTKYQIFAYSYDIARQWAKAIRYARKLHLSQGNRLIHDFHDSISLKCLQFHHPAFLLDANAALSPSQLPCESAPSPFPIRNEKEIYFTFMLADQKYSIKCNRQKLPFERQFFIDDHSNPNNPFIIQIWYIPSSSPPSFSSSSTAASSSFLPAPSNHPISSSPSSFSLSPSSSEELHDRTNAQTPVKPTSGIPSSNGKAPPPPSQGNGHLEVKDHKYNHLLIYEFQFPLREIIKKQTIDEKFLIPSLSAESFIHLNLSLNKKSEEQLLVESELLFLPDPSSKRLNHHHKSPNFASSTLHLPRSPSSPKIFNNDFPPSLLPAPQPNPQFRDDFNHNLMLSATHSRNSKSSIFRSANSPNHLPSLNTPERAALSKSSNNLPIRSSSIPASSTSPILPPSSTSTSSAVLIHAPNPNPANSIMNSLPVIEQLPEMKEAASPMEGGAIPPSTYALSPSQVESKKEDEEEREDKEQLLSLILKLDGRSYYFSVASFHKSDEIWTADRSGALHVWDKSVSAIFPLSLSPFPPISPFFSLPPFFLSLRLFFPPSPCFLSISSCFSLISFFIYKSSLPFLSLPFLSLFLPPFPLFY